MTTSGADTLALVGVNAEALAKQRRRFAKPCLDWTERWSHGGGALGAAPPHELFNCKWLVLRCRFHASELERMVMEAEANENANG